MLGDEKGLKEVFATKGPASTRPCLSCKNIVNFMEVATAAEDSYLQRISCEDPRKFDRATDDDIFQLVEIVRAAAARSNTECDKAEVATGIHHEPHGLLFSDECRSFIRPNTGWLRDWMHVLLVSGVANSEVMQLCLALKSIGVKWPMVTEFFAKWRLPKCHGKVNPDWFTGKRLGHRDEKDMFKGFSGELLTIIPIMMMFLDLVIAPLGVLSNQIECFRLLEQLVKLFSLGAHTSARYVQDIDRIIKEHASLYKECYPDAIKPKWHHLFHVVDHVANLGCLLSCFVTERKHRVMKATANHAFRHYETTLTHEILNRMVDRAVNSESIYLPEYLIDPRALDGTSIRKRCADLQLQPEAVYKASKAVLRCGQISVGDVIMTSNRVVAKLDVILATKSNDGYEILCIVKSMDIDADGTYNQTDRAQAVPSAQVVGPVIWAAEGNRVRVVPPTASVAWALGHR